MRPIFHDVRQENLSEYKHPSRDEAVTKALETQVISHPQTFKKYSLRYMFTREPFDRALSGYFDKVVKQGWLDGQNMTLSEFFKVLINESTNNGHFTEQLSVCNPCSLDINFLGRTETLAQDISTIVNNLTTMHERITFPKLEGKKNTSEPSNKSFFDITRLETLNLDLVYEFIWQYRHDYAAFAYNPYKSVQRFLDLKLRLELLKQENCI